MTKNEVLDYVMLSPANTNRAVLSDLLNEFAAGNSGNGSFIIDVSYDDENDEYVLNKTIEEIIQAVSNGFIPIIRDEFTLYQCIGANVEDFDFSFICIVEAQQDVLEYAAYYVYAEDNEIKVDYSEGTVSNSDGGSDTNGTVPFTIVNKNATPKILQYYNNGNVVTGSDAYSILVDLVGGSINKIPILLYGGITTNLDNYYDVYYYSGSNSGGDSGAIYAMPVMRTLDGKQAVIDQNGEVTFSS